MAFDLENKLVIGVASSAIFNLKEADRVFREEGEEAYRIFSREKENEPFLPGSGFSFIKRLLAINSPAEQFEPIEVVLLSKNDADTGNRVFNSFKHYNMGVTRAAFTCGQNPYTYIKAFNASLFLSANERDVSEAAALGFPAGLILPHEWEGHDEKVNLDDILKIAFDFDGILADDSSEKVFKERGLAEFQHHEEENSHVPMASGPLLTLLRKISAIQKTEFERQKLEPHYKPKIQTAMVTARNAPAHERVIQSLRHWGIHIDVSFFLGGISKAKILSEYRPHIFFDDQKLNLAKPDIPMAMVHVPYGIGNQEK